MKSYQKHLQTLLGKKPTSQCQKASSIFPVMINSGIRCRLSFLNYWKLKRNIDDIECTFFIRDSLGNCIHQETFKVSKVKCYDIDPSQYIQSPYPFLGSLEVEFSSSENLVFPYPGVVIEYYGEKFLTYVHSAQRIFQENEHPQDGPLVESGFNIYFDSKTFPWISLINGPLALTDQKLEFFAINSKQEILKKDISIDAGPYQTHLIKLDAWDELASHLEDSPGCLKVKLFQTHSFPRLIVGNYDQKNTTLSVTHTYYDLSTQSKKEDYWQDVPEGYDPLALMLPFKEDEKFFTRVYFYPIYSPSSVWIDAEIYNASGELLLSFEKVLKIDSSKGFSMLDLSDKVKNLSKDENYSLRLVAKSTDDNPVPSRIKVGFDIGFKNQSLPCNICTNFMPANAALKSKPSAFRWAPLMSKIHNGQIWCLNTSPEKNYLEPASIECHFYRHQDDQAIERKYHIAPNGHLLITHDQELESFYQNEPGWCTITSTNPNISTYYFSEHSNSMVGGDHGF